MVSDIALSYFAVSEILLHFRRYIEIPPCRESRSDIVSCETELVSAAELSCSDPLPHVLIFPSLSVPPLDVFAVGGGVFFVVQLLKVRARVSHSEIQFGEFDFFRELVDEIRSPLLYVSWLDDVE